MLAENGGYGTYPASDASMRYLRVGVQAGRLPPLVERLAPREREIAAIAHHRIECSAEEIRAATATPISNSAVRTILGRLAIKGVVRRRRIGRKFVYSPATPSNGMLEAAFERLAQDYFEGSLRDMAKTLLAFLDHGQAGAAGEIGRRLSDPRHG